jgi:flagella basal body P-ring formation protein FlgA
MFKGFRRAASMVIVCVPFGAAGTLAAQEIVPPKVRSGEAVIVSLSANSTVANAHVFIRDVTILEGGTPQLRQQIASLDLADFPSDSRVLRLTKEQVFYRLRVSDIDPRLYRVEGAAQTTVNLRSFQVPEEDILGAAKQCVVQRLPGKPEDISIQLIQPIRGSRVVNGKQEEVRLLPELHSAAAPLGKVHVEVAICVNDERRMMVPVYLDVKLYQTLAVCARRIERGEVLTPNNVYWDRRALDSLNSYATQEDVRAGRRAKRLLAAGQVIVTADLEASDKDNPVLVKQHELVRLVARLGPLQVIALGEALQDGRAGQSISVRNVDSKKVVLGRVVERSIVEVDY